MDTVLYCSHHSFNQVTHAMKVGEIAPEEPPGMRHNHARALIRQGRDCLRIVTEYCHEHGMEAFWSMRMNDVHDGKLPAVRSHYKCEYPEL